MQLISHQRFKPNYLSEGSVSTSPILLTISIPPDTLPNTVCLPARNDKMSTIKCSYFVQNVSKAFSRNRQVIFPKKTNVYKDQLNLKGKGKEHFFFKKKKPSLGHCYCKV